MNLKGVDNIRKLAVSDIHGCHDEFNMILKKANYDSSTDQLILLGDYVDRGLKGKQVVEQVISLKDKGAIVLKGNHDDMMVSALTHDKEEYDAQWLNNGGFTTLISYIGGDYFEEGFDWDKYIEVKEYIRKHYQHHIDFLDSLPLYYEDDHHIYVHAGINPMLSNWKNTTEDDFIWIREPFFRNLTGLDMKVIFGHTPAAHIHDSSDIWFDPKGDKIGIDGACAYGRQLNLLEITEENQYIQHSVQKGEKYED
ncbi:metallophosphoesterase family protein [Paenibacillus illinoisensis]|nr:metallophosphoesterase family protein [Paenibacillus illinoisensis]